MRPTRSLGQALAAALQIVALLAFMLPGAVHAHAGAAWAQGHAVSHATHAEAGHGAHPAASPALSVSDAGAVPGDPGHAACPGCACGCHAAFGIPAEAPPVVRRRPARALPPFHDRAFASLTPEALPEPPRPFA